MDLNTLYALSQGGLGLGALSPQPPSPDETFARNAPYVKGSPSSFHTELGPLEEQMFQSWVARNNVPFDPGPKADYDMRGFYRALASGDKKATNAVDPNDGRMHYPDNWKTPYHETFSNESQWALPSAPSWSDDDKLIGSNGRVVFDDKAR